MYYFRVFLAGFGFCLFGIIGLLGNVIFAPIVFLGMHKNLKVQYFARDLVRWSWFAYLQILRLLNIVSYSIELNCPKQKQQMIIANHPSLLDVVFLLAYIPRANCVVKASLERNIFLRYAIKASGYIPNTNPEDLLKKSLEVLKRGENLIIFPEGTRTVMQISFHKAVSYLAINGASGLKMIYIHSLYEVLKKGERWYNLPRTSLVYQLFDFGEISLKDFESNKPNSLRVRALHTLLNHKYQTKQKELYGTKCFN